MAIDLHDECYYGEDDEEAPTCWVHKAQKKNGTRHFYRLATALTVRHAVRLTLAVVFVHPDDPLEEVVKKLLNYVRLRGLRIGCLYADKGFCTVAVLNYLRQHTRLAAIIAVPRRREKRGQESLSRAAEFFHPLYLS